MARSPSHPLWLARPAVFSVQRAALGAAGTAPTGRTALFALSPYFSATLAVDVRTYFGGCVAAAPKPVPTGAGRLPGSQAEGCSPCLGYASPEHPYFSDLGGSLLSISLSVSKVGDWRQKGGLSTC